MPGPHRGGGWRVAPTKTAKMLDKVLPVLSDKWVTMNDICRALGTWEGDSAVVNSVMKLMALNQVERQKVFVSEVKFRYLYRKI